MEERLCLHLSEDDDYHGFKATFLTTGQGRRPNPPTILQWKNKHLLQLYQIKEEGQKTWNDVGIWLDKLLPQLNLKTRAKAVIDRTVSRFHKCPDDKITSFLSENVDFNHIDDCLASYGITRDTIFYPPGDFVGCTNVTNEFVVKLMQCYKNVGVEKKVVVEWVWKLGASTIPLGKLQYAIKRVMDQYNKLSSSRGRDSSSVDSFLQTKFCLASIVIPASSNSEVVQIVNPSPVPSPKPCKFEMKGVMNALKEVSEEKNVLEKSFGESQSAIGKLQGKIDDLNEVVRTIKQDLKSSKKQEARLENVIMNKDQEMADNKQLLKTLQERISYLENKSIKLSSKNKSLKEDNRKLKNEVSELKKQIFDSNQQLDVNIKSGHNNTYTDNVRQTVLRLTAEGGVSEENVENVLRIVSKGIFNYDIRENLPCRKTCHNITVEGHVLSSIQAAEAILKSENVTLHVDGTSRDQKKFVNHQITLDDSSNLYLGFSVVATEDANTILDVTISILKRLSDFYGSYSGEEKEKVFHDLLLKITSTMTDRAASMKSFGKKFQEFITSETGKEHLILFLNCNAHFLLGLSDSCTKGLRCFEKEMSETGIRLGRDNDPQFAHFDSNSETSTVRLIRTLCDIFGPRPDQKNGRREDWKVFCPTTTIPSFKSNRFNCFFLAAASIIHHLDDLKSFFQSGVLPDDVNRKVKSVCADILDDNLVDIIYCIAILYLKVSGPFWSLLHSSVKYVDFYEYVKDMSDHFHKWAVDPSELIDPNFLCLFGERFALRCPQRTSVDSYVPCNRDRVSQILIKVCGECSIVTERQLSDFISGRFSTPSDSSVSKAISHCELTNLIGESAFGDLDYDIRKRANCSVLSRSSSHSVKRNKTASHFLDNRTRADRAHLMSVARKRGRDMMEEVKEHEKSVANEVKRRMIDNQEKKIQKAINEITTSSELMKRINENGGLCNSSIDIDELYNKLLQEKKTKAMILSVFKDQLRFHKVIKKQKHLHLGGSLTEVIERLKEHISD